MNWQSQIWNQRVLITRSRTLAPLGRFASSSLSWCMRHNPLQLSSPVIRNGKYLNAGCGRRPRSGFINLDYTWQPGVNLLWDLRWRLPFQENSLKGIYTEHCLEHLPLDLVTKHVLPEFQRVLLRKGRLRLIVPDGELFLKLYSESRNCKGVTFPCPDEKSATPMMHVNRCFRDFGHLYAYDFETIRYFLVRSGFPSVERRSYMDGGDPALLLDSEKRAPESLYVEAIK
jgi:predicted SAM-dependent methyltransferase